METPKVVVVDYELGNLWSVLRACEAAGIDARVSGEKDSLISASGVILPGVGTFGDAMDNLRRLDLCQPLLDFARLGRPILGICLGMQLLMTESEEFGIHKGLGLIPGTVTCFPRGTRDGDRVKVPHVGWNQIHFHPQAAEHPLLKAVPDGAFMYFQHSFHVVPANRGVILTSTVYGGTRFASEVTAGNVMAFQFHPEVSARDGLAIYANFKSLLESQGG